MKATEERVNEPVITEAKAALENPMPNNRLPRMALRAAAGKIATLLIESDRRITGRLDGATGRIEVADLGHPQVDDLLDDLCELVGKMGGRVMVLPAERMPGQTGLAAIYRY